MPDETKVDWSEFRKRIEYEDTQLTARVNVLLVFNALAAAAFSISSSAGIRAIMTVVVVASNLLLCLSTVQTALLVRNLTTEFMKHAEDPIDKRVRLHLRWVPRLLRSTVVLGVWLPLVILAAWVVGFVFSLTDVGGP